MTYLFPESVEDEQSTARIDISVQSGIEESVFHDDQFEEFTEVPSEEALAIEARGANRSLDRARAAQEARASKPGSAVTLRALSKLHR